MSLPCKLVPGQYRGYEYGLFCWLFTSNLVPRALVSFGADQKTRGLWERDWFTSSVHCYDFPLFLSSRCSFCSSLSVRSVKISLAPKAIGHETFSSMPGLKLWEITKLSLTHGILADFKNGSRSRSRVRKSESQREGCVGRCWWSWKINHKDRSKQKMKTKGPDYWQTEKPRFLSLCWAS